MNSTPTVEQTYALLEFMSEHLELARGQLRTTTGRFKNRQLWEQLTEELNAIEDGCIKTVKQWQKVWSDKKYLTRKAAAAFRQSSIDGSPAAPPLTPMEERVAEIIGEGHSDSICKVLGVNQVKNEPYDDEAASPCRSPALSMQSSPSTSGANNGHTTPISWKRRRRPALSAAKEVSQPSIRKLLIRMQQRQLVADTKRLEELGRIREAIVDLCHVGKELLQTIRKDPLD